MEPILITFEFRSRQFKGKWKLAEFPIGRHTSETIVSNRCIVCTLAVYCSLTLDAFLSEKNHEH